MDLVNIFKALGDKSRIEIVKSLNNKSYCVEELSEIIGISPSTVSFHLRKLEKANLIKSKKEQYYKNYSLNKEILNNSLIKLISEEKNNSDENLEKYKSKIIKTFFKYGKLKSIPVQRKKRRVILDKIAKSFESGKVYSEREVNIIIADFHDDFCTIRREFISEKIFKRDKGMYQLID